MKTHQKTTVSASGDNRAGAPANINVMTLMLLVLCQYKISVTVTHMRAHIFTRACDLEGHWKTVLPQEPLCSSKPNLMIKWLNVNLSQSAEILILRLMLVQLVYYFASPSKKGGSQCRFSTTAAHRAWWSVTVDLRQKTTESARGSWFYHHRNLTGQACLEFLLCYNR